MGRNSLEVFPGAGLHRGMGRGPVHGCRTNPGGPMRGDVSRLEKILSGLEKRLRKDEE